jgi:hypothetical protein
MKSGDSDTTGASCREVYHVSPLTFAVTPAGATRMRRGREDYGKESACSQDQQ